VSEQSLTFRSTHNMSFQRCFSRQSIAPLMTIKLNQQNILSKHKKTTPTQKTGVSGEKYVKQTNIKPKPRPTPTVTCKNCLYVMCAYHCAQVWYTNMPQISSYNLPSYPSENQSLQWQIRCCILDGRSAGRGINS